MVFYRWAFIVCSVLAGFGVALQPAFAQTAPVSTADLPACEHLADGADAQPMTGRASYSFLGGVVAQNGPDYWQPQNGGERALCRVESFSIEGETGLHHITVAYAGFLKAVQTLLLRIDVTGAKARTLYVLYTPALDLMSGEHLAFTLVEAHADEVDIYAMYHSAPTYSQIRIEIENILMEKAKPALSAHWPKLTEPPVLQVQGQ